MMRRLFEDKRLTTGFLLAWMCVTCITFSLLGISHVDFMTFGPSEHTVVMGMVIDTWDKWSCLAIFSFISTCCNEFIGNSLVPWFQNTIQDHKNTYLPYPKHVCIAIVLIYELYGHVVGIFALFMLFSQIDFLLIRASADLVVNFFSTIWFLNNKRYDPTKYRSTMCAAEQVPDEATEEMKLLGKSVEEKKEANNA